MRVHWFFKIMMLTLSFLASANVNITGFVGSRRALQEPACDWPIDLTIERDGNVDFCEISDEMN